MIIKPDDIRRIRPVANNIDDLNRIEPYIKDAETLDVLPVIGASLYKQLDELDLNLVNNNSVIITNNQGEQINLDYKIYTDLLNGCYYECSDCSCNEEILRHSEGLISAIAYLAYSRLLPNHPINVTAFSVVYKYGELSDRVDESALIRATNQAKKIGMVYLNQCIDYMKCKKLICDRQIVKRRNKFKAIG